jgi:hypothetical protein
MNSLRYDRFVFCAAGIRMSYAEFARAELLAKGSIIKTELFSPIVSHAGRNCKRHDRDRYNCDKQ